jgi:hypothetical protein
MPFYEGLLFNKRHSVSNLFKQRDCKHTQAKDYIFNDFKKWSFEETGIDLKVSGMPYIRTLNANSITGELVFYQTSLLITSLIFSFDPLEQLSSLF